MSTQQQGRKRLSLFLPDLVANNNTYQQSSYNRINPLLTFLFLFFLPFTYALTVDVAFPLKISELALFCFFIEYFYVAFHTKFRLTKSSQALLWLLSMATLSFITNVFWTYDYDLKEYVSRFGYTTDSLVKLIYYYICCFTFFISTKIFSFNEAKAIKYILAGAFVASLYSWYLFFSSILNFTPYLLPGIEKPQLISLSIGLFIRSGTFGEGNFMGLFLIFSMILSLYSRRVLLSIFFGTTMITTFSSIGLVSVVVLYTMYYFKKWYAQKRLSNIIAYLVMAVAVFTALLSVEDFRFLIISKFNVLGNEVTNDADGSRIDRLNQLEVATKIGLNNPFFGVGLSNYGRHYGHYNTEPTLRYENFKNIPNNVYAEFFCEVGIIGLVLLLYFLKKIYNISKLDNSGVLSVGLIVFCMYFVAYPTMSILFIWVYFGFINAFEYNEQCERCN